MGVHAVFCPYDELKEYIKEAKTIMDNLFQQKHILVAHIFYYGSKKIEYEIHYNETIITISLVDDLSYKNGGMTDEK